MVSQWHFIFLSVATVGIGKNHAKENYYRYVYYLNLFTLIGTYYSMIIARIECRKENDIFLKSHCFKMRCHEMTSTFFLHTRSAFPLFLPM